VSLEGMGVYLNKESLPDGLKFIIGSKSLVQQKTGAKPGNRFLLAVEVTTARMTTP